MTTRSGTIHGMAAPIISGTVTLPEGMTQEEADRLVEEADAANNPQPAKDHD